MPRWRALAPTHRLSFERGHSSPTAAKHESRSQELLGKLYYNGTDLEHLWATWSSGALCSSLERL